MFFIPRYVKAIASRLVDDLSCLACAIESPLCTRSVGSVAIFTDDQSVMYDLSLCIAISAPNIM